MTEHLNEQLSLADAMLRQSEAQLDQVREVQALIAGIVGRGEAAEGLVVVEYTAGEGLSTLEINPRAMRLPSVDLADAIKAAIRAAAEDFRARSRDAIAASTVQAGPEVTPEQVREQIARMREQLMETGRTAAEGLARAQALRDASGR